MSSIVDISGMDEEELQLLYTYIDSIPLSRPKRNIARDFSDAVMMAEVVKYYYPKLVQMHNYSAASSVKKKTYNWNTLNQKVLKKLHFNMSKEEIERIVKCAPGAIELLLRNFQIKITQLQQQGFDPTIVIGRESSKRTESTTGTALGTDPIMRRGHKVPHIHAEHHSAGGQNLSDNQFDEMINDIVSGDAQGHARDSNNKQGGGINSGVYADAGLMQNVARASENSDGNKAAKIRELQETVHLLEQKVNKLNMLVRLKDSKITALSTKLKEAGLLR